MRNIKKNADQGREIVRKNGRLDLGFKELNDFMEEYDLISSATSGREALFQIIGEAYYMGLAVGKRAKV